MPRDLVPVLKAEQHRQDTREDDLVQDPDHYLHMDSAIVTSGSEPCRFTIFRLRLHTPNFRISSSGQLIAAPLSELGVVTDTTQIKT